MTMRAQLVLWSSVVGQSISIIDDEGRNIVQLGVRYTGPVTDEDDDAFKARLVGVAQSVADAVNASAEREAATNTRAGLREAVILRAYLGLGRGETTEEDWREGKFPDDIAEATKIADAILALLPVQSAVDAARARADEDQDRLRSALYRILERYGAESDVLALVGSLWDTLETSEVVDLMEDWLRDGETLRSPQ